MSSSHERAMTVTSIPRAARMASHQMYQIMANPNTKAKAPMIKPCGRVFRHLDVVIVIRPQVSDAFFLHVHKGIDVIDDGYCREVIDRGRRRGHPLQGAAVPGIAGRIAEGLALLNADEQLNSQKDDAERDHGRTQGGDEQIGMPGRVGIIRHAAGHAHEAQHIQGKKGKIKADQPAPEGAFAPTFLQTKADGLGEPITITGQKSRTAPRGSAHCGNARSETGCCGARNQRVV